MSDNGRMLKGMILGGLAAFLFVFLFLFVFMNMLMLICITDKFDLLRCYYCNKNYYKQKTKHHD